MTGWAPRAATRARLLLSRTSAVTSCPPRTSASSTAAPMYPVAPVRKIRIARPYIIVQHVARDTLIDFFHDLARAAATFSCTTTASAAARYTYERGRARRARLRRAPPRARAPERRQGCLLEREPSGVDRRLLGLSAARHRRRADRLSRVAGLSGARQPHRRGEARADRSGRAADHGRHRSARRSGSCTSSTGRTAPHRRRPACPTFRCRRDDVAEIIFTSGATAEPKGVVITHRNVLANIVPVEREVLKYRKWGRPFFPVRFLNLLPLSHMFGQAMATFIPPMLPGIGRLHARATTRARSSRRSGSAASRCSCPCRRSSTCCASMSLRVGAGSRDVPGPKQHFAPALVAVPRDPSAVRAGSSGRSSSARRRSTATLEAFWSELGFVVIQGYGLTETAPIVSLNHPFGTKKGSVGKAIAGVEVKIAPDGEILVRGENVTRGYFNADEETARAFEDGWFHTGDIGEIADDGQLLHPRPQEGDDRHARGAQRLSGRRRAGAACASAGVRDAAVVGARIGTEERVHAVARPRRRAPTPTRSSGRPTPSSTITRRSAARSCGRSPSCRAPKARAS